MSLISKVAGIIALLSGALSSGVQAYDVLVSVTGTITGNSCTVAADSKTIAVPLGTLSIRQFAAVGDTSNITTPFFINLEECGPTFSGVKITFQGIPDEDNHQVLKLSEGEVTGVGVQILNKQGEQVALGEATTAYGSAGSDSVQAKFFARLIATRNAISLGQFSAVATYILEYQ